MPRVLGGFILALMLALSASAFAQTPAPSLTVENAWVRKPPPGIDTAAVYFTLKNAGAKAIHVVSVTSTIADHVMVHESSMADGQSRMRMRDQVAVAPGKSVMFAPEGLHVMLSGLHKALAVGDKVPLTLQLEGGVQISVAAVVRPLDAK